MTQIFNEDVHVKGDLEVQNTAGDPQVVATEDGRLLVADASAAATPDAILEVQRAGTSTSRPTRGLHVSGELVDETTSDAVAWSVHEVTVSGSGTTLNQATALRASVITDDDADLDTAVGVEVTIDNESTGTITDAVGVQVNDILSGTNKYAIRTGSGAVSFGDFVEVKRTAVPGTPATDYIRIYPKSDGKLYAKNWVDDEFDLTGVSATSTPPGAMMMYAGAAAPSGWLLCDGQAVSRTTYANLFGAIGVAFGSGDGSTTFNLPDLRGRAPIGAGHGSGLTNRTLANQIGAEQHMLTVNEMPSHSHNIDVRQNLTSFGNELIGTGANSNPNGSRTTSSVGSGQAHNNMQPSLVVNFIIKA